MAGVSPGIAVPCGKVGASESGALERGGGVSAPAPTMSAGKRVPGIVGLSESLPLWSRSSIGIAWIRRASGGARLSPTTKATFASGCRGEFEHPALRYSTEYTPEVIFRKALGTLEIKAFWRLRTCNPGT